MRTDRQDLTRLAALFDDHRELRAVIDAVLEGRLGRASADSWSRPSAARLDLGCYSVFAGDPNAPRAPELAADVAAPRELVYQDPAWRPRLFEAHPGRLHERPMRAFTADVLDRGHLNDCVARLADGYELRRLDAGTAHQLDARLEPHALQTFADPNAFATQGLGFGAFLDDALVCAATSYTLTSTRLELAIATRADHRGRGLATATAARLALECLRRDLEPCWNAANPVSQRLAVRLGFRPAGVCEVLYLEGAAVQSRPWGRGPRALHSDAKLRLPGR